MVRLSLLFAACVAAAATGVVHAESEAEAARVKVVLRVHEHGKSVSDTIGDVWDTVKNETSDAIESVADELHDALYGSGSNDTEDEPVEIVVVKQTVLNHKVVNSKTIVRHFKEGEEEEGEGEGEEALIEEIENALFGSEAGSASTSGSGSNSTEATEVGDENEGSTEKELTAEDEGSLGEEEEEEEEGELPMPPPVKKHHKKKHHAAKHHQAKKHHHAKKHHEAKKQQAVKEEVKTVQKETNTMATATDVHTERRPSTTFVLIGAAVGAMVGIVALAVFVAVRRRRSASAASVLATHESDVEAINQEEEEEDVEDAAAPVVEDLEKGDAKVEETLEGSV